ncbi:MAG: hypothetical protein ACM3Y9_14545 [Ignavibacteria bacterium]
MAEGIWVPLILFVAMLVWLKRTDYGAGCTRFRELGCENPGKGRCSFPDCERSKTHKPKKFFVW